LRVESVHGIAQATPEERTNGEGRPTGVAFRFWRFAVHTMRDEKPQACCQPTLETWSLLSDQHGRTPQRLAMLLQRDNSARVCDRDGWEGSIQPMDVSWNHDLGHIAALDSREQAPGERLRTKLVCSRVVMT